MLSKRSVWVVVLLLIALVGCSLKKYAINMVGDALASGNSVYETDDDIELVGDALPFGLKLIESLLLESPNHRGLLLTAARGFVLYSYSTVADRAEVLEDEDLDRARALRLRARKLYLRGLRFGQRGLEVSYPGFSERLFMDPEAAVAGVHNRKKKQQDVPFLYWSAAALGLAVSVSRNDAAMLARLPEVEAMLDRALELDETWEDGSLHEFAIQFASSKPGEADYAAMKRHYDRVLELAEHPSAGVHLSYAEAVSLPQQDKPRFRTLLEKALAVDPDAHAPKRLVNLLSQRRARRLLDRIDDLIFDLESVADEEGTP